MLALSVLFALNISAQNIQTYKGPYIFNDNVIGIAEYEYKIEKRDTVKQGRFIFHAQIIDTTDTKKINSILYKGSYNNGLKSDRWTFSYKSLQPDDELFERKFEIIYTASGIEYVVDGVFKEGKAIGQWQVVHQNIVKSTPSDIQLFVKSNYENGKMKGSIEGYFKNITFTGFVNGDGFIDKIWTFKHQISNGQSIEEQRIFDNGILKQHSINLNGDIITLKYVGIDSTIDEAEEWEELRINNHYFNIIKNANMGIDSLSFQAKQNISYQDTAYYFAENTNVLLKNALTSFTRYNGSQIWKQVKESEAIRAAMVRFHKFPLKKEEEENINKSSALIKNINEKIYILQTDPNIELNIYAFEKLMFYYEVLKVYQSQIQNLSKIIEQFKSPVYLYINREEIFEYMIPNLQYPKQVSYEFKDVNYADSYNFPALPEKNYNNFQQVKQHVEAILKDVADIEKNIGELMEEKQKETMLIEKEKMLVKRKDSIVALYDKENRKENFNTYHEQVADKISAHALKSFKDYAGLETEQKNMEIDNLLQCYENFLKLYDAQAEIPKKLARLDENYTRTVWNPYTMTDMDERVKERVYRAFELHLLPYYLKDIEASIDCEKITDKHKNFETLYRKMMELRDRDTKDIEKELRRVSAPERIMEILEIKLYPN